MDILNTLNGPELVVRFQKYFGVIPRDIHANEFDKPVPEEGSHYSNGHAKVTQNGEVNGHCISNGVNGHTALANGCDTRIRNGTSHRQNGSIIANGTHHPVEVENMKEKEKNKFKTDEYEITNKFFYYLFHFGANLGNEVFYITFYPFWIWNIDGFVGRRVCIFWALFMYIGQATKDILKIPRPASPPVMRMEKLYALEYGMPSTHAMVGAGFPFTILFLTWQRYIYPVEYAVILATLWTLLVCCSRLYLGMHSVLDVLAGLLYVFSLMPLYLVSMETIDHLIITNLYSPLFCVGIPLIMCVFYPKLDRWSTARGDTTIIVSVASGVCVASHIAYQIGSMQQSPSPPPYTLSGVSLSLGLVVLQRFVIGVLMLVVTRAIMKFLSLKIIGYLTNLDTTVKDNLQLLCVELPYKFITYFSVAITTVLIAPGVFSLLGIQRDSYLYEL